ncbi:hypothetical protein K402DRAFT_393321 [Aulographum hederae CBS 113979]|uniref:Uncharacterized protein n=1 Tax=Aulographum hederae CBS 113979 TaxID=1176131 RepID=A0A6G1H104_9PEZI|nr:hypothetical protein K402DRAFT_393321 [Aulographum hederae CBS 113979]
MHFHLPETVTSKLPNPILPLKKVRLPRVAEENQDVLARHGWTAVEFGGGSLASPSSSSSTIISPPSSSSSTSKSNSKPFEQGNGNNPSISISSPSQEDPLETALFTFLTAAESFFALTDLEKSKFSLKTRQNSPTGKSEGWARAKGKEYVTIRTLDGTPDMLRPTAQRAWQEAAEYLEGVIGGVGESLGLGREGLSGFIGEGGGSLSGKGEIGRETMLRLFRYDLEYKEDGDNGKEEEVQILSAPHQDLGLLTLVVSTHPGLVVRTREFPGQPARDVFIEGEGKETESNKKKACLLSGKVMRRVTNGKYPAGTHAVVAFPRNRVGAGAQLHENDENGQMVADGDAKGEEKESFTPPPGPPPGWQQPPFLPVTEPVALSPTSTSKLPNSGTSSNPSPPISSSQSSAPSETATNLTSSSSQPPQQPRCRYSLIFALRPSRSSVFDPRKMQNFRTGRYAEKEKVTGGEIMDELFGKSWDVNRPLGKGAKVNGSDNSEVTGTMPVEDGYGNGDVRA